MLTECKMNDQNGKTCRFCMRTVCDNDLNLIGDITRQMLDFLLLELNCDVGKLILICNECATKLQNAAAFKTYCLNSERKLVPLLNSDENVELVSVTTGDELTCHFCRMLTGSGCCTYLDDKKEHMYLVDMVKKHIPELYYGSVELITCKSCLASLQDLLNFIKGYLTTRENDNVRRAHETNVENQLIQRDIQNCALKNQVTYRDVNMDVIKEKCEQGEDITLKNELKAEIDDNQDPIETDNQKLFMENKELDIKLEQMDYGSFQDTSPSSQPSLQNMEIFEDNIKGQSLTNPHRSKTKKYACERCSFITSGKWDIKRHIATHRDLSEVTVYKCELCSYRARQKCNLKTHMLTHQNTSNIKMYNCQKCSFVSKWKKNLKIHSLSHEDFSTAAYTCDQCPFRARQKGNLKMHMLNHRSPSEIKMYHCQKCPFKTKWKVNVKSHSLIHEDPSNALYICETCSFQTKRKDTLRRHERIHQNTTEVAVYICETCSFQTNIRSTLVQHMLTHQAPVYKCEQCSFRARQKGNLKTHMLTHRSPTEIKMYNCQKCPFKTKFKGNLRTHSLTHEDPSKAMYTCETCSFSTRQKNYLKSHMLTHQGPSQGS